MESIEIGMTVKYKNMRGSVVLIYSDAPSYAKVCVFPQDAGWNRGIAYQNWPVRELEIIDAAP